MCGVTDVLVEQAGGKSLSLLTGFGAGVQKIQPSVVSVNNVGSSSQAAFHPVLESMQEPIASSIEAGLHRNLPSLSELGHSYSRSTSFSLCTSPHDLRESLGNSGIGLANGQSGDPRDRNPYAYRADEIGNTHGIPGVGHMGSLLTPPAWKEGDEPIDPQEAADLFIEAQQALLMEYQKDLMGFSLEEQLKERERQVQKWIKHCKINKIVIKERIEIYVNYKIRQRSISRRGSLETTRSVSSLTYTCPRSYDTPTRVSTPFQHGPFSAPQYSNQNPGPLPNFERCDLNHSKESPHLDIWTLTLMR